MTDEHSRTIFCTEATNQLNLLANKSNIQIVNCSSRKLNDNEIKLLEKKY